MLFYTTVVDFYVPLTCPNPFHAMHNIYFLEILVIHPLNILDV